MEILVVDDDPAVLRSLQRALALAGYRVQTADGGASTLDAVVTRSPTPSSSTCHPGRTDGTEALRAI